MTALPHFDANDLERLLPVGPLIDALSDAFLGDTVAPHRMVMRHDGGQSLVMPSWREGGRMGSKLITVRPGNPSAGLPSIQGVFVLSDSESGTPLATMDGRMLTLLRTAAASALASRLMARGETKTLAMLGAGSLAPHLVRAHAAVLPIRRVLVWNRTSSRADALVDTLKREGLEVRRASSPEEATRSADLVSAATFSRAPLIRRGFARPGLHVDLVGAFTPEMCEAAPDLLADARIVVDTMEGARDEAGDLIQAVASGTIEWDHIVGDLRQCLLGEVTARTKPDEITVFKSVGTALEDLAAGSLAYDRWSAQTAQ